MNDKNTIFKIKGGKPLIGEIEIGGAKNAATKIIVATILVDDICILENVPKIRDVINTLNVCEELGATYEWLDESTLKIDTTTINNYIIPAKYSGAMRISILFVAPLLFRMGKAELATVGGCNIGARPIDYHLDGLKKLGVDVEIKGNTYTFTKKELRGNVTEFGYPSVGATENLVMAAVMATGRTTIKNAAIEPEIENLIGFLQAAGAIIYQNTSRTWIIDGVNKLRGVKYRIITDRIEAASYATCAIATKGDVFVKGADQRDMVTFLNWLRKAGGNFEIKPDGIRFYYEQELTPVVVETDVHPGFMTDWQPSFLTMLTQAKGVSIVHETVYENRLGFVSSLNEMGAKIQLHKECLGNLKCRFAEKNIDHSAVIVGGTKLEAQELSIPDLRAGFAYVMAALIADGESTVYNTVHVKRGYSHLVEKITSLGGDITELDAEA